MSSKSLSTGPTSGLDTLERSIVDHVFRLQPGYAVFLGLHEYDGKVPDFSRAGTEEWTSGAEGLLHKLRALPPAEATPQRQLDRTLLELLLEGPLFDIKVSHDLERNPMSYVGSVSLTAYMVRNYAPAMDRAAAMTRTLDAIPKLLADGRRRLSATVPEPFVTLSLAMGSGLPTHFEEGESFVAANAPSEASAFRKAREGADLAVREFMAFLDAELKPKATPDFALGAERFQRLLYVREGITTPTAEILSKGWNDLHRNQARLEKIAQPANPSGTAAEQVSKLLSSLYLQHSSAEQLIPDAQKIVAETRAFVEANGIATIPPPDSCRVEETPSYGRALSTASMNPPGPFDQGDSEGIYYVTPVDPSWPKERQEEWLRSLNLPMLRNVTIHEVYPGHYLQFLHFRASTGSLARKVYFSPSFTEGWAHYCEQLAIEVGWQNGSVEAEAAELHDALLRDCRLIASIMLHTQGWRVDQATQLFREKAHFEQLPAEREAIRGTFNPEYFCYTLGKLAILEAREKLLDRRFAGSLKAFHDRLLSFGAPPVGVLTTLLES
ncbi:MAG: DUF885 domain-containing protein [Thermoplasmata archaeon]|nr:DUF885 domain-containing protein [Thermoplasmata archaeon]